MKFFITTTLLLIIFNSASTQIIDPIWVRHEVAEGSTLYG